SSSTIRPSAEAGVGFVLVTGTGSGVGKTWVMRVLARTLQQRGLRVLAVKPVEIGCDTAPDQREDGILLAEATGQAAPRSALIRYGPPLPPALAAGMEAEPVDFDALLLQLEPLRAEADLVLLEGTGGLLTPITWEWNAVELARSLGAGALVVVTAPATPDASTGLTAGAVSRLSGLDRVLSVDHEPDPLAAADRGALNLVTDWLA
ncbi:MAG TPA: dethiobiotin synthase, partial [Gemmatimonadales bacterium]|nr:dethiobiotin synthase [Gemmatimonadales bacterium]